MGVNFMNEKIVKKEYEYKGSNHVSLTFEYGECSKIHFCTEQSYLIYVDDDGDAGWIEETPYPVVIFDRLGDTQDARDLIMEITKIKSELEKY